MHAQQNLYTFLGVSQTMTEKENFEEDKMVGEPEQFLEPEEHTDTHAEHRTNITAGNQDADVYTEEGREELKDDDEVANWEEGFAQGAEGKGHLGVCAHCGEVLGDRQDAPVEKEYSGIVNVFCSDKCAQAGPKN